MRYLISIFLITVFWSSIVFSSCTEKETVTANTQQDILIRHKWKHYQTRTVTIDTTTNIIIKDTVAQTEICYQNSLFVFAADSVVKRTLQCFTPASNNEGRWYLKPDSTFAAPILVRTSYGTGWIYTDFGLPYGKMILLTEIEFRVTAISTFNFGNTKSYHTYFLKATN
jgi:hypothetical protein